MKNNTNIPFWLFILPILLLQSCVKEVELDLSSFESKLVLNAMVSTTQTWSVKVSKSGNALSNIDNIEAVNDATVTLRDMSANRVISLHRNHNGIYSHDKIKPIAGHTYRIKISHPDYTTIHANTTIPITVDVEEIGRSTELDEKGNEIIKIDLDVNKNKLDITYYFDWAILSTDSTGTIEIIDPSNQLTNIRQPNNTRKIVESGIRYIVDETNNTNQNLSLSVSSSNGDDTDAGLNNGDEDEPTIELTVTTISEAYYKYYLSLNNYRALSKGESKNASVKSLYTNVENGFGIFGSYNIIKHQF